MKKFILRFVVALLLCGIVIGAYMLGTKNATNVDVLKETNNEIVNQEKDSQTNNDNVALNKFKEVLTNKEWIENNLSLKKNSFAEEITNYSNQQRRFEVINNNGKNSPILVVLTKDAKELSFNIFIIRYINDEINVEQLQEIAAFHNSHYVATIFENKLCISYGNKGYCSYIIYEISNDGKIVFEELKEIQSDYAEIREVKEKYNLKPITLELNEDNIDKYIK